MITTMRNKRLDYVDAAKALAIILVVFGHTTSGADDIKHLIYSFHVPVFFILYGFVVKLPPSPPPFKETVAKCFKRYLFPYFWMMVLCGGLNLEKAADYLNARQSILTRYEPLASWFLPCFFLSVLIYALIVQAGCRLFSGRRTLLFVAGASLLFLALGLRLNATRVWNAWFYYNEAFVGVGLIGIGLLFRKGWDALNADALPAAAAFGLSLVFAGILGYAAFSNGFVAMVLGQYGNRGLFLLSSVSGTLCLLLLSKSIHFKVHNTPPPILSFLGKNSIVVMMFHHWGFDLAIPAAAALGIEREGMAARLLITFIACLLTGILSYVINKRLPFIIGKTT